jgi:hypothetical protein
MSRVYRVVISYRVVDETFIDADSLEDAQEIVQSRPVDTDWIQVGTDGWQIELVEEVAYVKV